MLPTLDLQVEPVEGRPDARVLRLAGEIDFSSSERTWGKLRTLLESGSIHLLVDCHHLRFVNSQGLGILLHFSRATRERGGSLRLCSVPQQVYEIIEIIGALPEFDIHDSVEEALTALD